MCRPNNCSCLLIVWITSGFNGKVWNSQQWPCNPSYTQKMWDTPGLYFLRSKTYIRCVKYWIFTSILGVEIWSKYSVSPPQNSVQIQCFTQQSLLSPPQIHIYVPVGFITCYSLLLVSFCILWKHMFSDIIERD